MHRNCLIKINEEDVAFIMDKCYRYFKAILSGAYCNTCKNTQKSSIINYSIFLNGSNDIVINGCCDKCGTSINRCIETGEKIGPGERAEITWMVKVDLLDQKAA